MSRLIVHVAEVELSRTGGMGRVAHHWKDAFERRGDEFVHIGLRAAGRIPHRTLFPQIAYQVYRSIGRPADVFVVHEPASGVFVGRGTPTVVFSHGIERRYAALRVPPDGAPSVSRRLRSLVTAPIWRLRQHSCDRGLRLSTRALLLNRDDEAYAKRYYGLSADRIFVFRNGVNAVPPLRRPKTRDGCQILFLGSWINRKGIASLCAAATLLFERGIEVRWVLAGTGVGSELVLAQWPLELRGVTTVIPRFEEAEESPLLAGSDVFVLPSLFEGQPLALLQAMACGLCCVVSECCGQRDLIQPGFNGLFHEPGNAVALAEALELAVTNRELRAELGGNAERSVRGRTWEAVSDEVVDFIHSVL